MVVLSLFDGMSCGQLALNKAGIKITKYYASEIDTYAQKVSKANFPNTVYLGDVRNISNLKDIDILIGGSPCQSFSFAGKRKGMSTKDEQEILTLEHYLELKEQGYEFEGQSYLFWEYIRILKEIQKYNPNVLFFLENVIMVEKWRTLISTTLGIAPIMINSSLVSAQNRRRYYWTNIYTKTDGLFSDVVPGIGQPKDEGILLKNIIEENADEKYFITQKAIDRINRTRGAKNSLNNYDKSMCLTAGYYKQGRDNQFIVHNMQPRSGDPAKGGTGHLTRNDGKTYCLDTGNTNAVEIVAMRGRGEDNTQQLETNGTNKSNSLTTVQTDNLVKKTVSNTKIRRLLPIECERLQTVPDNYTNHVSDTQRYKMLGNGWTVNVIAHIFKHIPKT